MSSSGLVLYGARLGSVAPGIRSIWCSIPRNGGKPAGTSAENTSSNSCKTLETGRKRMIIIRKQNLAFVHKHKGMVVGSSQNSLMSALVANISKLGSLALFVIDSL